jgi:hypothetical protein
LFSEQEKNDWLDLPLLLLGFPSLILWKQSLLLVL